LIAVRSEPRITVSLVTYNGSRWLDGCLDSLERQTLQDFELLVIDNASSDETVEELRGRASRDARVQLTESDTNLGYAAAHNLNIRRAQGEFVVLLNQDVELDPEFLAEAIAALEQSPSVGSIQARVRKLGPGGERTTYLDTTGLVMHRDRRVVSRAQGEPDGAEHSVAGPIWGVDGPVAVYRKAALLNAREPRTGGGWEILDEDFFLYKEDVDLAWRMRLLGWQARYEPAALAWHARGAGGPPAVGWRGIVRRNRASTPLVRALSWRNQRLMQLKCDTPAALLRDLPWVLRREVLSAAYVAVADPWRLHAVRDLLRLTPSALRKRHFIWRRVLRSRHALASQQSLSL
jgi:GT2 family glycosyltransferase